MTNSIIATPYRVLGVLLLSSALVSTVVRAELSQKQIHQEMLGNARANVDFSQGHYESARILWEELAAMGNAHAMYSLGLMYRDALGVLADPERAFGWFEQAAQQGEPRSLLELSHCWRDGVGTRVSPERADDLLRRAAFAGVPEAQQAHGEQLLRSEEWQRAGYWLERAVQGNMSNAEVLVDAARRHGYKPSGLPLPIRQRVGRFLEEMDSALNSRDPDMYAILIDDNAVIRVSLPGEAESVLMSPLEYTDLWSQTFSDVDRFRAHRGNVVIEAVDQGFMVNSEVHEYAISGDNAQQLDLSEQLSLKETPYGLRASAIHLEASVPSTPLLAP